MLKKLEGHLEIQLFFYTGGNMGAQRKTWTWPGTHSKAVAETGPWPRSPGSHRPVCAFHSIHLLLLPLSLPPPTPSHLTCYLSWHQTETMGFFQSSGSQPKQPIKIPWGALKNADGLALPQTNWISISGGWGGIFKSSLDDSNVQSRFF